MENEGRTEETTGGGEREKMKKRKGEMKRTEKVEKEERQKTKRRWEENK